MQIERQTVIYALSDPRNPKLARYIGQTKQPLRKRLLGHLWFEKSRPNYPVSKWIDSLLKLNLVPVISTIEVITDGNADERETAWIRFFKPLGNLLNQSDGPGMLGMKHPLPQEHHDKVSRALTGKKLDPERKQRWSEHPNVIRSQKNIGNYNRKLGVEQILEIRRLRSSGLTQAEVAKKFGLAQSTVSMVVNKQRCYACY